MVAQSAKILVVDDESMVLESCRRVLAGAGYDVETASGGLEAYALLKTKQYDLMLLDLKMPDVDGLEVLERAKETNPTMVVAIITGYGTVETAVEAMKKGAYDYISKPISASSLEILAKRALETARLQQEIVRIEREKENFIHTIYHEFKAPIADVTVYLKTLAKVLPLDEKQRHTLSLCEKRLVPLKELTEDLLQMTKAEFLQRQKKITRVDLLELVGQAVASHSVAAAEAGVSVGIEPASESVSSGTEREGIGVVLNNLIRNAIRYNRPGGSVIIKVGRSGDSARIEISDTGIGISEKHLPLIFDEFYRVREDATRDICGTGLGLSIVKRILDSLGGSVSVKSEQGKGSVFTVEIPLKSLDESTAGAPGSQEGVL